MGCWHLFKRCNTLTLCFKCLYLYLFLLISCDVKALPSALSLNFSQVVEQVENLEKDTPVQALEMLNSIEDQLPKLSLNERVKFYTLQSSLYASLAQFQLSLNAATLGLKLSSQLSSPSIHIAELSYSKGFATESLGNLELALQDYKNGLEVARSLDDKKMIAEGLTNLGAIYYLTERFDLSIVVLNDALVIANQVGDEELQGGINSELGNLYSNIGQDDKSMQFLQRSYQHYKNSSQTFSAVWVLSNIATSHYNNEEYDSAIRIYNKVIAEADDVVNNPFFYGVYTGLALSYIYKEEKEPEVAYRYFKMAEQYVDYNGNKDMPVTYLLDKAIILKNLQRYDEALESIFSAEKLLAAQERPKDSSYFLMVRLKADIYYVLGQYEKAYRFKSESVDYRVEKLKAADIEAVEELRLRYESKQADLHKKILEQKRSLNNAELAEANKQAKAQQFYLMMSGVVALIFVWLLSTLVRGQKKLRRVTHLDDLTGLVNRHRLLKQGQRYFSRAKLQHSSLVALMIDIDNFKEINDRLGHQIGDEILKKIAMLGKKLLKRIDIFGRFSAEEFIIFLPESDKKQAMDIAQQLKEKIERYQWQLSSEDNVSISIGFASYDQEQHLDLEALIKNAEKMLYRAKNQGGNCICG